MEEIVIPWSDISGANPDSPTPPPAELSQVPSVTPETPATPETPVPPVETAVTDPTTPEVPAGVQPQAPPVEEPAQRDEGRFRLKGKMAHVARLTREGVPDEEAIERVYGKTEEKSPEPVSDPLKAIDEELAQLQPVLDSAGDEGSLITSEYRKAQKREAELLAERQVLKFQQAQAAEKTAQTQEQQFSEAENKSWGEAKAKYRDLDDPNSELSKRVAKRWNEIADNPADPLYTLPNLPKMLTLEIADELGIAPGAITPQAPATPAAKPGPLPLQPAPGSAGRTVTPIQQTEAQKEAAFTQTLAQASDDEALKAALTADLYGGNRKSDAYAFR